MGTNGVLSITEGHDVLFKVVVGVNGRNAITLAKAVKKRLEDGAWQGGVIEIESLYNLAHLCHFGTLQCRTVVSKDEIFYAGDDVHPSPDGLYRSTFECAYFNPRWGCGIADCIVKVDLRTLEIREFNPEWSATF